MTLAIVTDSTSCLPPHLVREHGIHVVPLRVEVDGQEGVEGVDLSPDDVVAALRRGATVSTSRPGPTAFEQAYAACASAGADEIVSVHVSEALSGTAGSARLAAASAPVPVRVVDSRTLALALGHAVVGAAEVAAAGGSAALAEATAAERAGAATVVFSVDSLEQLRRGGRIGAAAAWLGQVLAIKPVLGLRDGEIVPLERVRTTGRAEQRLVERGAEAAGEQPVDIGVHHVDAGERADRLAALLRDRVQHVRSVEVVQATAVVSAHTGPGTLAVSVTPAVLE